MVQLPITPGNLVTSVLAGMTVALLAGLVPAIQAAREEPADTVRRIPFRASWIYRAMQAAGSIVIIQLGLLCIAVRGQFTTRGRAGVYPEISAGRHRFTVRFMNQRDVNTRPVQTGVDVPFQLQCCAL